MDLTLYSIQKADGEQAWIQDFGRGEGEPDPKVCSLTLNFF